MNAEIHVQRLDNKSDAKYCAALMADSEPWITLRRGYEDSLEIISDPSREVYMAKQGDEITGFVVIEMQGAFTGYIKSICVSPEHRSRKIGTLLMRYAEARIFSETPNVFLCVSDFNEDAQRFYQRLGYTVVGELKDYIVSGYSEILMRKTVGPLTR